MSSNGSTARFFAAAKMAKERHPEQYCPVDKCLWHTVNKRGISPCEKHSVATGQCDITLRHWSNIAKKATDPSSVRVNGKHYMIYPDETDPKAWKGHGGAKFIIRFFDGREVVTHNLWAQGTIPQNFRRILSDNADSPNLNPIASVPSYEVRSKGFCFLCQDIGEVLNHEGSPVPCDCQHVTAEAV